MSFSSCLPSLCALLLESRSGEISIHFIVNRIAMACNSIFYKFSLSRFLSIWILSYKCSYLFYNIPNNNFYRPLCVYMDDFGEAIKAIRERRWRQRWEETANVICRKVSAENCHSRSPPLPPKSFPFIHFLR